MTATETDLAALTRFAAPVPRYTSYPTANHFSNSFPARLYEEWLAAVPPEAALSLYLHIPFCHTLCWYCACHTRAVRRYEPVAEYLVSLRQEMARLTDRVRARSVRHIHWGGGSPNAANAQDIRRIGEQLHGSFRVEENAEHAVEIDPRQLTEDQVAAFADVGVNRISLGVQDFEPIVQAAIGRKQGYAATARAVDAFRAVGVRSINMDLVYGLPHQTTASAERTLAQVLSLEPDRIAIFGYAHMPQRMKNQRLIDAAVLPDPATRLVMSKALAARLGEAGYRQIGIDHFAKPDDAMAAKPVQRNFQGYTTDPTDVLLGLGASAISRLPQGFAQNVVPTADYMRRVAESGSAIARGIVLSDDDRARAFVIERLMCDFAFEAGAVLEQHGPRLAAPILATAKRLIAEDRDGLVEMTDGEFRITARGRPFTRSICAAFDAYLPASTALHSAAV